MNQVIEKKPRFTWELMRIYVTIVAAAMLLAVDYQLFIVKNAFAPAGLNGIATMIQYKTGFSIGYMSLLINIPLCTFAWFAINRQFASRSMCFCLVYSFTFLHLQKIGLEELQYDAGGHDTIFPVIISGLLSGVVYSMSFASNGSTGGTDIVSKYINRKKPELNFFWVNFILNAAVASASFFVYAQPGEDGVMVYDYKPVCLCMIYCFLSSFVGNYIITGSRRAVKFTIITSHPEQVTRDLLEKLHRGVTNVAAEGAYGHESKSILLCVVNRHQIVDFLNILKSYPDTFTYSETVNEIYGNFKKIK